MIYILACAADHTHNTCYWSISLAGMSQKRKLSSYSLAQKYDVLMLLQRGEKASKISRNHEAISGINIFFQSSSVPEHVFNAIKILEDHALKTAVTRTKKQCKITDMFKKE